MQRWFVISNCRSWGRRRGLGGSRGWSAVDGTGVQRPRSGGGPHPLPPHPLLSFQHRLSQIERFMSLQTLNIILSVKRHGVKFLCLVFLLSVLLKSQCSWGQDLIWCEY